MQRCSIVDFLVVVCIAGALSAVAPQACGSRVLMYMGAGLGRFGLVFLFVLVLAS